MLKIGKMPCRNPCKECPWLIKSCHNDKWPSYVESVEKTGKIKNKRHACHMITSDTWGYKDEINDSNVCIGSLQVNSNL